MEERSTLTCVVFWINGFTQVLQFIVDVILIIDGVFLSTS